MLRFWALFAVLAGSLLSIATQAGDEKRPAVTVDRDKKLVIIPAKVAPRKLPNLDQVYPIEVIATWGYREGKKGKAHETVVLQAFAHEHGISLNTVFQQVNGFAQSQGLPLLKHAEIDIHKMRNSQRGKLVSETLFAPLPPSPSAYLAAAERQFHSDFFPALRRMVQAKQTGAGYVQQVMDIPMQDALALHGELAR